MTPDLAQRVRDEFFPKSLVAPERISGLEPLMEDGVTFKYLRTPLTREQFAEVIQIPAVNWAGTRMNSLVLAYNWCTI